MKDDFKVIKPPERDYRGRPIGNIPKPRIYGRERLSDKIKKTLEEIRWRH